MFRAPLRPSSGAYNYINSLWFFSPLKCGGSSVVGHGRARPRPTALLPPHSNGKKTRGC